MGRSSLPPSVSNGGNSLTDLWARGELKEREAGRERQNQCETPNVQELWTRLEGSLTAPQGPVYQLLSTVVDNLGEMMQESDRHLPIGRQIHLLRKERGLTLEQIGRNAAGTLNFSTVSKIETGSRTPAVSTLEVLAGALRCEFRIEPGKAVYLSRGLEVSFKR